MKYKEVVMERRSVLAVVLAVALVMTGGPAYSESAIGSAFGTLATARSMGQGKGDLGFGIGIADGTTFIGSFAYGLSQYSDGRIKLALSDSDYNSDIKLVFGVDYKWQFWSYDSTTNHPFDFAFGAFMEFVDYSSISVLQVGTQLLASYPVALKHGRTLSPYGRFNARVESISYDRPPGSRGDDSQSNLEVGFNGGVKWEMTNAVDLYGEFQFDGNDGIFFGIDFNVM